MIIPIMMMPTILMPSTIMDILMVLLMLMIKPIMMRICLSWWYYAYYGHIMPSIMHIMIIICLL